MTGRMMGGATVEIVGAGPTGLSAAIAARATGARVIVYEQSPDVGARFHGDFQGLENWTSRRDVLEELSSMGIAPNFVHTPVREVVYFGPDGAPHRVRSNQPMFYLIRRGGEPGTLDRALKDQALRAGVTIHFETRKRQLASGGVVADGPHRADVIAVGYIFETDMADGCYLAMSNELAGAGYSYLLVDRGRGTIAACLFDKFHQKRDYLEHTVAFFQSAVGLRWSKSTRFGGIGNVDRVQQSMAGDRRYMGEAAGFQDALFGFGLRYAMTSGHLAGAPGAGNTNDSLESEARLRGLNAASILNRWIFDHLGERGRALLIRRVAQSQDPRRVLRRVYEPARWKSALCNRLPRFPLRPNSQTQSACDCTWCRCYRKLQTTPHDLLDSQRPLP